MAHGGDIRLTSQEVLNESYDWLLSLIGISLWGYDDTAGSEGARRIATDNQGHLEIISPLPMEGQNSSLVLSYDTGNLVSITKIINGVSYIKILSYTGSDLTGVSEWSLVA